VNVEAIWLTTGPVRGSIEDLLLAMLEPSQSSPSLRRAVIEELGHAVKLTDVILDYLNLEPGEIDAGGELPLRLVAPRSGRDPWGDALVVPGGDCPIGVVVGTRDQGRVVLVHEVVRHFGDAERTLVRRYAALLLAGGTHDQIVATLAEEWGGAEALRKTTTVARRHVQLLDPAVIYGPDGAIRVQLGSLSETTKNLMREGLAGEHLFILPGTLFEGRTNYGDIEFLVYLNFFARQRQRTRIAGTARQRRILKRVLTLTIFGLFDPGLAEQPTFEALRDLYGVPDRETYNFFRTAYETYGIRRDADPGSPLLTIDDYIDFIVLDTDRTVVPMPGAEVYVTPTGQGFAVEIVMADGRVESKRLELALPHRIEGVVPAALRQAIQFATDRPRLGVTPLGTSHGFDPAGDLTSFVVWVNGKGILVDPSSEALRYLEQIGVAPADVPYVFLTHVHADHDGGLIEKLLSGSRTNVIASDAVFRAFVEKTELLTGHDFRREGLVKHIPANPHQPVTIQVAGDAITLETRWNFHPIPTNGFRLSLGGRTVGYSGDTQYDPDLLTELRDRGRLSVENHEDLLYFFWGPDGTPSVDLLYHEAGVPPIHTERRKLDRLPEAVRTRMALVHVADKDVPAEAVPGKPRLFATQMLLPPNAASRTRAILDALRLVPYLYDAPVGVLETLANEGEVREWAKGEVIIRKGSGAHEESLSFFAVLDGEVAVRDGRRHVARLVKGDSFGEWGISHQRGVRVADVVATRDAQGVRFGETQYGWLVEQLPAIQERIGTIRTLLPRLQLAQERARLAGAAGLASRRSVLEYMSANQLSSFALFSRVQTLKAGETVVVEGAVADGFYVLLSGHLTVSAAGHQVGEVSEGDAFGEMGLLEGGRRGATIRVASADAEVLFMSTRSFQNLLDSVPAFAWEIWAIASDRRRVNQERHRPR
jgi:CRP-like cAMP-binding protein